MTETWEKLYNAAKAAVCPHELSQHMCVGSVGAAVLTKDGNIYTGICIDTACSHGEYEITHVCAVYLDGSVMPPCGACREFMMQMGPTAKDIEVLLNRDGTSAKLGELMPHYPY